MQARGIASRNRRIVPRKRSKRTMPRRFQCATALSKASWVFLVVYINLCAAQIGQTVCICSPASYDISFDFSQTCNSSSVNKATSGIITTDCAVAPFQDDSVTDLVPVSVGSIDVLELDQNLVLLTQSSRFGTYQDGDTLPYTSISSNPSLVNVTKYPRAFQISVIGSNVRGETLFFAGLIVYSTDCSVHPNLQPGSTIGWVKFVSPTVVSVYSVLTNDYQIDFSGRSPSERLSDCPCAATRIGVKCFQEESYPDPRKTQNSCPFRFPSRPNMRRLLLRERWGERKEINEGKEVNEGKESPRKVKEKEKGGRIPQHL